MCMRVCVLCVNVNRFGACKELHKRAVDMCTVPYVRIRTGGQ